MSTKLVFEIRYEAGIKAPQVAINSRNSYSHDISSWQKKCSSTSALRKANSNSGPGAELTFCLKAVLLAQHQLSTLKIHLQQIFYKRLLQFPRRLARCPAYTGIYAVGTSITKRFSNEPAEAYSGLKLSSEYIFSWDIGSADRSKRAELTCVLVEQVGLLV